MEYFFGIILEFFVRMNNEYYVKISAMEKHVKVIQPHSCEELLSFKKTHEIKATYSLKPYSKFYPYFHISATM
jgi:hypothetical protein